MDRYKVWSVSVLVLIALSLAPLATFNYYLDPLWTFAHANDYNRHQMPFDERRQKTNYLTFTADTYDALLIGSSRATYLNRHNFPGRTYNYAVNGILLPEYAEWIAYAVKQQPQLATLYLALDFYATNANIAPADTSPADYIREANSPFYRWKILLSRDVYRYARKNYEAAQETLYPANFAYDRDDVKALYTVPPEETARLTAENIAAYRAGYYAAYSYADVPRYLDDIRSAAPETDIVAFTTPVSSALLLLLQEQGLYDYYEQWLTDIVEVYGEVWHFMYLNPVTADWANFYDASHVYPEIGARMARIMTGQEEAQGFGMQIRRDNLAESLAQLRELNGE
jgi:hypothetical protein